MDGCMQPSILLTPHNGRPFVFANLESCMFMPAWSGNAEWAHITSSGARVYDAQRRCVVAFGASVCTCLVEGQLESYRVTRHMYECEWRECPLERPGSMCADETVLVWGGGEIAAHLSPASIVVDSEEDAYKQLATRAVSHVVHVLENQAAEDSTTVGACLRLLRMVRAVKAGARPKLWLVTRRAQGPDSSQQHASISGLVRSVNAETASGVRCAYIDVDSALDAKAAAACLRQELSPSAKGVWENEVCTPQPSCLESCESCLSFDIVLNVLNCRWPSAMGQGS